MERAQTEPLAAIIAVSMIALAMGMYAVFVADTLPGQSEPADERATVEIVWDELQDEGVYPNSSRMGTPRRHYPVSAIDPENLPTGENVYVNVTTADEEGNTIVVGLAHFDEGGDDVLPSSDGPPPDARTVTRPVPVEMRPGEIRGGTLRVEVW